MNQFPFTEPEMYKRGIDIYDLYRALRYRFPVFEYKDPPGHYNYDFVYDENSNIVKIVKNNKWYEERVEEKDDIDWEKEFEEYRKQRRERLSKYT
jgi:hypothetical protein